MARLLVPAAVMLYGRTILTMHLSAGPAVFTALSPPMNAIVKIMPPEHAICGFHGEELVRSAHGTWVPANQTEPCRATSGRIGCPDCQTVLVCHQPHPHPGLNHYDAAERIWWARTDAEPILWHELAAREA